MSLQTAKFLIQRNSTDYKITGERIENQELEENDILCVDRGGTKYKWEITKVNDDIDTSDLRDTDQLICIDGSTEYKVSGARFKTLLPIFYFAPVLLHIKFIAGGDVYASGNGLNAYRTDTGTTQALSKQAGGGFDKPNIPYYELTNYNREYYLICDEYPDSLFRKSTASGWEFASNTRIDKLRSIAGWFFDCDSYNDSTINNFDTSKIEEFGYCFQNNNAFNQPLNNWDTSNAIDMTLMFSGATQFNQDISGWCVSNITSEPTNFAANGCPLSSANKPVWGTCP